MPEPGQEPTDQHISHNPENHVVRSSRSPICMRLYFILSDMSLAYPRKDDRLLWRPWHIAIAMEKSIIVATMNDAWSTF